MATLIQDSEIEALVRRLADARGTSFEGAVRLAVKNELARELELKPKSKRCPEEIRAAVREIQEQYAALPEAMTPEEVDAWMYDENGLPH